MKAKPILQLALTGIAFVLALVFAQEAAAMLTDVSAQDLFNHTVAPIVAMPFVSLANIDGSSWQAPNPGGNRRLLIIQAKDIAGVWPKKADITAGEIAVAPTFVATAKFGQYSLPDGTFDVNDAADGDQGFQSYKHTCGFMLAGFSAAISAEIAKHLNAGCLIVAEMNDGTMALVGTSDNPIYLKSSFGSGKKGSDKRGYTFKGEQDGFMWGVLPIKSTIAAALPLIVAV